MVGRRWALGGFCARRTSRRWSAIALSAAAIGSVLPVATPMASAIPTVHEITASWAGTPAPTDAPFGATRTAEWHINTNDASAAPGNALVNNVRVTVSAVNGVFTSIPAVCKKSGVTPPSAITAGGTQLLCNLGTIREGTATVVQTPVKASSTTGGFLSLAGTVSSDSGPAAGPASPAPLPITYTHGMDLVISAPGSYYQAKLEPSRTGGNRFFVDVDYALTLSDGSRPGPSTYSFPLSIAGNPAAQLNGLQWEGCATVSAETAALGIPYSDPARADRTNAPTCTIAGGPNNYTVTLSGLDYSLVNSPTKDSLGNALPAGKTFIAAGTLHFSIPVRTQVLTGVTFTASPPPFTFTDGQTFPQTDTTNDTTNTTMIPLGGFSASWQGGPARGRSAWDPNLWVAPGTSEGLTFPVPGAGSSTNPGRRRGRRARHHCRSPTRTAWIW